MTSDSPFTPACTRESFLETQGLGEVLRRLDAGLGSREPFLLITGAPGTGKTALACEVVARWDARVAVAQLAYPALAGAEFLEEIIRRFGAEPPEGASRSKLVARFEQTLAEIAGRGQVAMIVVDDAHGLSVQSLEELRLLVNAARQAQRPLEVLLIGLPALEATLDDPALVALRQRVSVHARLEPFSPADTQRYLHHRISVAGGDGPSLFSRRTSRDIAARTGGVPRRINALAGEALRLAREAGDPTVVPEHLRAASANLGDFASNGDDVDEFEVAHLHGSPAPAATPRAPATLGAATPAPSLAAARAPASAPSVAPVPTPAAAPAPAARIERFSAGPIARAPVADAAPEAAAIVVPTPPSPANLDPHEWVARFVGDKGPVQIGSRAVAEPRWTEEPSGAGEERPSPSPGPAAPRRRRSPPPPPPPSKHRDGLRLVLPAVLVAIVVVTAVALVMRSGGLARSRAGKAAAAASRPSQVARGTSSERAAAPRASATDAAERAAPQGADVEEPRVDASIAKSRGPFTLDVGGYSNLESALDQRDEMQRLTGFEGWVVPAGESGGYRIVLNVYGTYARATSAANMLLRSKTLDNVTVVPLPPRSQRR